jgi:hypothetical protein
MTICRSKASVTFALILLGTAATAPAQQTPPPSQQPATPAAPLPAVHVVQQGETLWGLAQQYFGDPLLWPEIYRLNTDVVEDPWWIFPGEELRLQSLAAVAAEPTPAAPTVIAVTPEGDTTRRAPAAAPPQNPTAPTIFATINRRQSVTGAAIEVDASQSYRAVRAGEYYAASFLTEGLDIGSGRLLGNVQSSNIRRLGTSTSAQLYTEVAIQTNDSLRAGDLLIAVRRAGELRGYGEVVKPTGLLRVTAMGDNQRGAARVVALYGAVSDGQEVLRIAPYDSRMGGRPVAVSDGVTGEVIGLVNPTDIVQMQAGVFLNRGAAEGVRLGDTFQLLGTDRTRTEFSNQLMLQAEAVVVNVRPHTATAIIVNLQRPDVRPGSTARQVRRMPT